MVTSSGRRALGSNHRLSNLSDPFCIRETFTTTDVQSPAELGPLHRGAGGRKSISSRRSLTRGFAGTASAEGSGNIECATADPACRVTESDRKGSGPSRKVSWPPRIVSEPPRRGSGSLRKGSATPSRASVPSRKTSEQARKMSASVRKVYEPVHKVNEPTQKVCESTHKVNEPTQNLCESARSLSESARKVPVSVRKVSEPTPRVTDPIQDVDYRRRASAHPLSSDEWGSSKTRSREETASGSHTAPARAMGGTKSITWGTRTSHQHGTAQVSMISQDTASLFSARSTTSRGDKRTRQPRKAPSQTDGPRQQHHDQHQTPKQHKTQQDGQQQQQQQQQNPEQQQQQQQEGQQQQQQQRRSPTEQRISVDNIHRSSASATLHSKSAASWRRLSPSLSSRGRSVKHLSLTLLACCVNMASFIPFLVCFVYAQLFFLPVPAEVQCVSRLLAMCGAALDCVVYGLTNHCFHRSGQELLASLCAHCKPAAVDPSCHDGVSDGNQRNQS